MPILELRNLQLEFRQGPKAVRVLDGVSFALDPGRVLGLVGESGSGKSVTALSIGRLVPSPPAHYAGGEVLLEGRDVLAMSPAELCRVRGAVISYIFQEPGAALNPVMRVGAQIREALTLHRPEVATDAEVVRLLQRVGIPAPESRRRSYPHELSGGMQQRVMIAMALATQPKLLIADEPTTALDVTIQAQVMELLGDLRRQLGMAILLITHNLGLVGDLADDIAVMYAGQIVEQGPVREVLQRPLHPYTQALIRSVPALGDDSDHLRTIPGTVPIPGALPAGCRFHPRCRDRQSDCTFSPPALAQVSPTRHVRCPYTQTGST